MENRKEAGYYDMSRSPVNRFQPELVDDEEEEPIEEDIQNSENQSPPQDTKAKTKALYPSQQPGQFRGTESETFRLDTMTGLNRGSELSNHVTPLQDRLSNKPYQHNSNCLSHIDVTSDRIGR